MNHFENLKKALDSAQEILKDTLSKIPAEFQPQIMNANIDVADIMKAVENNDMDKLTEISKKYANPNNK